MRAVDLTHTIAPSMPIFPGTTPPDFVEVATIEDHGYREKRLTLSSHTGTHLDAPAHILDGAKSLDSFPVDHFVGRAVVLDLTATPPGKAIEISNLSGLTKLLPDLDFLLIRTGWSRFWGEQRYFTGYPVLSVDAANWLTGYKLKGVGIDAISFDAVNSTQLPLHRSLLGAELLLIENLTNLAHLPDEPFIFTCFPLKIEDADGSPVRATALIG